MTRIVAISGSRREASTTKAALRVALSAAADALYLFTLNSGCECAKNPQDLEHLIVRIMHVLDIAVGSSLFNTRFAPREGKVCEKRVMHVER